MAMSYPNRMMPGSARAHRAPATLGLSLLTLSLAACAGGGSGPGDGGADAGDEAGLLDGGGDGMIASDAGLDADAAMPECLTHAECDDANACTADRCDSAGSCAYTNIPAGSPCDDMDACTDPGTCDGSGLCVITAGGDMYEPNETRAGATGLGRISDGDDWPSGSFDATLYPMGDVDFYSFHVSDDFLGLLYPRVEFAAVPAGSSYELCAYYACDSGSATVGCRAGSSASTFDGLQGCCGSPAELDPDCSGTTDEHGTVVVRVQPTAGGAASCEPYTITWGDN